ncbi:hypothetical protein N7519_006080 [Penicillium mononematosum]|uniref:uncharacterized protein n=1 Tax=Penicillium mononematosum TaxID=268346 RepID=UPI002548E81D|nr:uncharacterized protein N7519_006080 [Penicillium mononematosum]KAJ6184779.1 hypothetical protein N7519_006080 [Penicillium mononematosum]
MDYNLSASQRISVSKILSQIQGYGFPYKAKQYPAPVFAYRIPTLLINFANQSNLIFCQDVTIIKIGPEVAVNFVFAYYTYGPINRDIDDPGSLCDTYFFIRFIGGKTLHIAGDSFISDFNTARIEVHQNNNVPNASGMLQQSHRILFTHFDLQPQNNMIKDGNVVAIRLTKQTRKDTGQLDLP